jgi:hypothetical protein
VPTQIWDFGALTKVVIFAECFTEADGVVIRKICEGRARTMTDIARAAHP